MAAGLTLTTGFRIGWRRYCWTAPRMETMVRNGLVGCNSTTASTLPCSPSYQSSACRSASALREVSVASSGGRSHGTDAPQVRATSAISASSVVTSTSTKAPLASAGAIVHAISGLPPSGNRFLRGRRLLPPRAGTMASRRSGSGMEHPVDLELGALEILHASDVEPVFVDREHVDFLAALDLAFEQRGHVDVRAGFDVPDEFGGKHVDAGVDEEPMHGLFDHRPDAMAVV